MNLRKWLSVIRTEYDHPALRLFAAVWLIALVLGIIIIL